MLDGAHEDCQEFLIAAEIERKSGFVADRLTHSSIGQYCFFFFKQKTAYEMIWYWSSDVCSSDLLICGPAGVGKSWLASALGHKACRDNRSVLYQRVPQIGRASCRERV